MSAVLETVSLLLLSFPLGVVISVLTERVASRNVMAKQLPRVWTTLVKGTVTYLIWKYIIFYTWSNGAGFGSSHCQTTILSRWLQFSQTSTAYFDLPECDSHDSIKTIVIFFLRGFLFASGASFGASLQPVGLTGGIACGKSTVCNLLKSPSKATDRNAFAVIDVDGIAHDILVPGKMGVDCGYKRVVNAFHGDDIFEKGSKDESPPIDRRKLGDVIFKDPKKRRALNGITHPLISKVMLKQIMREGLHPSDENTSIVSVDIPLLYEVGLVMRLLFGIKVVIACDEDVQLKRLMDRNKDLTKDQCLERIKSQIPVQKKAKMADIVIWNNGSKDELVLAVEEARSQIISRSHALMGFSLSNSIFYLSAVASTSCLFEMFKSAAF